MKIICAGASKTGTKSLHEALSELGYTVYDFMDHFWEHDQHWKKIFEEGGTIEDFKMMYENVDVVLDVPVFPFWEEISQAFPDAKIILSLRDPDEWTNSLHSMFTKFRKRSLGKVILNFLCPTVRRLNAHCSRYSPTCFGIQYSSTVSSPKYNKMLMKKKFKEHNTYVLEHAPKDRLLIFKSQDGWKPLCEFLGKKMPKKPYPWRNKDGNEIMGIVRRHPCMEQIKREAVIAISTIFAILALLLYWLIF